MTQPKTPGEAITLAAQRIKASQEAAKAVAQEIADKRAAEAETTPQIPGDGTA